MKGRQGRLTKTALKKMKRSCGKAICNHVNRSIHSQEERDATVHAMQTEIMAGFVLQHQTKKDTSFAGTIIGAGTRRKFLARISLIT